MNAVLSTLFFIANPYLTNFCLLIFVFNLVHKIAQFFIIYIKVYMLNIFKFKFSNSIIFETLAFSVPVTMTLLLVRHNKSRRISENVMNAIPKREGPLMSLIKIA